MGTTPPDPKESSFPTLLGNDGGIDLASGAEPNLEPDLAGGGAPADAWVADRDRRRTLTPPPVSENDRVTSPNVFYPGAVETLNRPTLRAPGGDEIHREIADRFALGDFAAVLRAAELQLGREPNDEVAAQYAKSARERLEAHYAALIGSLDHVFAIAVPEAEVRWLGLDPQASSLLALVDGALTVHGVLEASPMERLEALRVFTELLEARAIERVG